MVTPINTATVSPGPVFGILVRAAVGGTTPVLVEAEPFEEVPLDVELPFAALLDALLPAEPFAVLALFCVLEPLPAVAEPLLPDDLLDSFDELEVFLLASSVVFDCV